MVNRRSPFASVAVNLLVLGASWGITFVLMQLAGRGLAGWFPAEAAIVAGLCCGMLLALRVHARVAAVLIAGLVAFAVSELLAHAVLGIRAVQGGSPHIAVMVAGVLGVLFGVLLLGRAGDIFQERGAKASADLRPAPVSPPLAT